MECAVISFCTTLRCPEPYTLAQSIFVVVVLNSEWITNMYMGCKSGRKDDILTFPERKSRCLFLITDMSQKIHLKLHKSWAPEQRHKKVNLIFQDLCSLSTNIYVCSFCNESRNPQFLSKVPQFSVLAPVKHQQLQYFLTCTLQMPILLVVTFSHHTNLKIKSS